MNDDWNSFFHVWILTMTVGGTGLNYWLAGMLKRRATSAPETHWMAALVVGFLLYGFLPWPINRLIIQTYDVPQANQESVGYFVGPFVLAFIAFPAALFVLHRPSFRRLKSASTFSP
jgi:hypothetical protein